MNSWGILGNWVFCGEWLENVNFLRLCWNAPPVVFGITNDEVVNTIVIFLASLSFLRVVKSAHVLCVCVSLSCGCVRVESAVSIYRCRACV